VEYREGVCVCVCAYVRACEEEGIPYRISSSVLNSYGRCSIKGQF
jgi:hypothetical protein